MKCIKPLVPYLVHSKPSEMVGVVGIVIPTLAYSDSSFVLFFSGCRRDQGVSGDQVSIMVDGVQVALPSYEEAVYGSSGHCVPPADPRVQIVLSEGSGPSGRSGPREPHLQDQGACSSAGSEEEAPGQSGLCEAWGSRGSETGPRSPRCGPDFTQPCQLVSLGPWLARGGPQFLSSS